MDSDTSLITRVARKLSQPPSYAQEGAHTSILVVAATAYGAQTNDTQPTGFDPEIAALFEAFVESAYLVANADHDFDATERATFQHVVLTACGKAVVERQVTALIADLQDQLEEDGLEQRLQAIGRTVTKSEHKREVLRVAALVAQVSGGVSDIEQQVLSQLASQFGVSAGELEVIVGEAERAVSE